MILTLAIILTSLYVLLFCFFIYGISRLKPRRHASGEPTVSIVVAARNEEDAIHRCLESLASLDYPNDKLEVLLVDDQSTDRTYRSCKPSPPGTAISKW